MTSSELIKILQQYPEATINIALNGVITDRVYIGQKSETCITIAEC